MARTTARTTRRTTTRAAADESTAAQAQAQPARKKSGAAKKSGTTARRRQPAQPAPDAQPQAPQARPLADLQAERAALLASDAVTRRGLSQRDKKTLAALDAAIAAAGGNAPASGRKKSTRQRPAQPDTHRAIASAANDLANPAAKVSPAHIGILLAAIPQGTTDPLAGITDRKARAMARGTQALDLPADVRAIAARASSPGTFTDAGGHRVRGSRSFYGKKLVAMLLGIRGAIADGTVTPHGAPLPTPDAAPAKKAPAQKSGAGNSRKKASGQPARRAGQAPAQPAQGPRPTATRAGRARAAKASNGRKS